MRTIVISDIHGCYYTLLDLLKKVNLDIEKDKLIFLGDYIDRGKHSYETLMYIMELSKNENCIVLLGNHEQMMLNSYEYRDFSLWKYNGGNKTISSFSKHNVSSLDMKSILKWVKSLDILYKTDDYFFCHAGFSYPTLNENTTDDLLWGRNKVLKLRTKTEKKVVFGHTPNLDEFKAYKTPNGNIGIDSGCVYCGNLCAMIIEDGNESFVYVENNDND